MFVETECVEIICCGFRPRRTIFGAFVAPVCELGEEFFDGVEPRADVGVKRTWVRF